MPRKTKKADMFLKLAQATPNDTLGITWSDSAPRNRIVDVVQRSIAWAAGLVAGMVVVGVKMYGEKTFEEPSDDERPSLNGGGTFPRILVLKCEYEDCTSGDVQMSKRVRARIQELKQRIDSSINRSDKVSILLELQRSVIEEPWVLRKRRRRNGNKERRFFYRMDDTSDKSNTSLGDRVHPQALNPKHSSPHDALSEPPIEEQG
ncbi:hypothetical protein As57867_005386, partial [Aphanomyces stellatus]